MCWNGKLGQEQDYFSCAQRCTAYGALGYLALMAPR
jgi:hypothetical protein